MVQFQPFDVFFNNHLWLRIFSTSLLDIKFDYILFHNYCHSLEVKTQVLRIIRLFITFSRHPSCLSQSICFPEIDRFFAFVNSEKSACFNMFMTNFLSIFIFAAELSFRSCDISSPKTTSSSQCKPFSSGSPLRLSCCLLLFPKILLS